MTMQEAYAESRVEALKRLYVSLNAVKTALRETAPNMRDYWSSSDFERARQTFNDRMEGIARFQVQIMDEAKSLQKGVGA
ncbi:MAG: hypothetical protein V1755_06495 [Chloroflexota bacterium]